MFKLLFSKRLYNFRLFILFFSFVSQLAERKRKREQQAEEEKEMDAKKMKMTEAGEEAAPENGGTFNHFSNGSFLTLSL